MVSGAGVVVSVPTRTSMSRLWSSGRWKSILRVPIPRSLGTGSKLVGRVIPAGIPVTVAVNVGLGLP